MARAARAGAERALATSALIPQNVACFALMLERAPDLTLERLPSARPALSPLTAQRAEQRAAASSNRPKRKVLGDNNGAVDGRAGAPPAAKRLRLTPTRAARAAAGKLIENE